MNKIKIFDTTLRDGEQSPGCSMNLNEKLQMARQLERMNVDIIEAGFAVSSQGDFDAVSSIAREIKNVEVVSLARSVKKDIDMAVEALKEANHPKIHIFIATSPIHMEYKLKMSPEKVIEKAVESIQYAKKSLSQIEFSCEDATRSELPFLYKIIEEVIKAGATTINIPDTVGYTEPGEYYNFIKSIRENTPGIENVDISVHCHDDLGMAVANSLAAVKAGATQIECTVNGIGERAGNCAMEEVVMALKTRNDVFNKDTDIITTEIYRSSQLLQTITGVKIQPHKAIVGANAFAHESGIHQHGVLANKETYEIMTPESVGLNENNMVLGKHSGKHALKSRLDQLGYHLGEEDLEKLFVRFKDLADQKKTIYDQDLEALILGDMSNMEKGYELVDYSTATKQNQESVTKIKVAKEGQEIEEEGRGKGPVDAAFDALNKIFGQGVVLQDFNIHSVTKGRDALGETMLKLEKEGEIFSGKGINNDIIKSSILAYINAINNMDYFIERRKSGIKQGY